MTCFVGVFPPGVKAVVSLRPNSAYSLLLITPMPFAENIPIFQERSNEPFVKDSLVINIVQSGEAGKSRRYG